MSNNKSMFLSPPPPTPTPSSLCPKSINLSKVLRSWDIEVCKAGSFSVRMPLPGQAPSQHAALSTACHYVFNVSFLDCLLPRTVINVRAGPLSECGRHHVPVPSSGPGHKCSPSTAQPSGCDPAGTTTLPATPPLPPQPLLPHPPPASPLLCPESLPALSAAWPPCGAPGPRPSQLSPLATFHFLNSGFSHEERIENEIPEAAPALAGNVASLLRHPLSVL